MKNVRVIMHEEATYWYQVQQDLTLREELAVYPDEPCDYAVVYDDMGCTDEMMSEIHALKDGGTRVFIRQILASA